MKKSKYSDEYIRKNVKNDTDPNDPFRLKPNEKVSRLTIVKLLGYLEIPDKRRKYIRKKYFYETKCDCGRDYICQEDVLKESIRIAKPLSCGCIRQGIRISMGYNPNVILRGRYPINCGGAIHYSHIFERCYKENDPKYKNYGGRGIKLCKEWFDELGNKHVDDFCDWIYNIAGYNDDMGPDVSVNRYDNDKDYSPDNCYISYPLEQANNTTLNKVYNYYGNDYTIAELAKKYNVSYDLLQGRLYNGYSLNDAIYAPKFVNAADREEYRQANSFGKLTSSKPFVIEPFHFVNHATITLNDPFCSYNRPGNTENAYYVADFQNRQSLKEQGTPVQPFRFTNSGSTDFLLYGKYQY